MKLVMKSWADTGKICEFYNCLQYNFSKPDIIKILKGCVVIEYYFLCGPYEVFQPTTNPDIPFNVLTLMYNNWANGYKTTLRQLPEVRL